MAELRKVSSEFILLRESDEQLRRRVSQRRKSINVGTFTRGVSALLQEDDFQGHRDLHGILVHDDPDDLNISVSQHSFVRRIHTREGVLTFNPNTVIVTPDLEVWWITSPKWRRFTPLFCFFCIVTALSHLIFATILFVDDDDHHIPNPYVCDTSNCLRIGDWMRRSMNLTLDPCQDFYGYMCGNYRDEDDQIANQEQRAPPELQMWLSSSATFGDDILAKVLRKPETDRVLKFYKSCLDQRSREKEGLSPFIDLLDEIKIFSTKDLNFIAARVSNYTGDFMFFDYWYGHGRAITVDAMPRSILEMIANDQDKSVQDLTNLFAALENVVVKIGNVTNFVQPFSDGRIAATSVQTLCQCLLKIYTECDQANGEKLGNVTAQDKVLFDFKVALMRAEEIGFSEVNHTYFYDKPRDACLLDLDNGQLHKLPACLQLEGFDDVQIRFSYRVLWILRIFLSFAHDLDWKTFQKILNPQKNPRFTSYLFSEAVEFRRSWIETQCFKSLATNYGFLAFEAFAKDFETGNTVKHIQEYVRREQRILRKWIAQGKFSHLTSEDQLLLSNLTQPEVALNVEVAQKLYSFAEIQSPLRNWDPNPRTYFSNVVTSRRLSEEEMTQDWFYKDTFSPWNTKVASDLLLGIKTIPGARRSTTDNKDFIYVPLTMLTFPFSQTDFHALNYAGVASFVAREVLRLSLRTTTLENLSGQEISAISSGVGNSSSQCDCVFDQNLTQKCHSSYALHNPGQPCFDPTRTNKFASALAIKLAFEAFQTRKGVEYRSKVPKDPKQVNRTVEVTYRISGKGHEVTEEFHAYDIANDTIMKKEGFEKSQLRMREVADLRLAPKWLKGFENYSQNQLFFMEFLRLHCYRRDLRYQENVNSIIAQVSEFAKAWQCPVGSKMIAEKPWFQN